MVFNNNSGLLKHLSFSRMLFLTLWASVLIFIASSCSDDDKTFEVSYGALYGVVLDDSGMPVRDAEVEITDVEGVAVTGVDGAYVFQNVPIRKQAVVYSKKDFQTISATLLASSFNEEKKAEINITMTEASAKVMGTVMDAKKYEAPLEGVVVTLGSMFTTTGSDGKYIFESLVYDDYVLTFSKENYVTVTKNIAKDEFSDKVVTLDILMGGTELLPGLTANDLKDADKWYYSEYRGGGNADAYPHWDWACNYMSALTFWGNWQEQWEGTTLRIRNDNNEQKNPSNLDLFDSYTYGSKKITADNKILSLRVRTHDADRENPAFFGVQVVDLSVEEPIAEKIGEIKTHGSGDYADYHFDLSKYIGKEVIIAVGLYRNETGDYWKQLVLRRIAFSQSNVTDWNWISGTEVIEGWKLTHEMVRSTMPHLEKSFTGISPISAGRDVSMDNGYPAAYRAWRDVSHIGYEWSFVPLNKDPEVFPSEGYVIKTRGNGPVNTEEPESYFYSKFSIQEGSNILTFKTRSFGSEFTYFKLTAIDEEGNITHVQPVYNNADEAESAEDGCWRFKHNSGDQGNSEKYASFRYDLSPFNGKDVVIAIGVYNGELNGAENKLVLYNITLE